MKMRQHVTHAFCQLMHAQSHSSPKSAQRKKMTPQELEERRYFIAGVLFALALPAPFAWLIVKYLT
jgi:hypothetical protein